ncbi:hypothetical protein V8E53_015004 [Lactarius tabidus]
MEWVTQDIQAQLEQEVQLQWAESIDWRQNERDGCRGDWTFLHHHRALAVRAIKSATVIEGFGACHITDGAALVWYFAWLEEQLNQGMKLLERVKTLASGKFHLAFFVKGSSFTTASSTGPNAELLCSDYPLLTDPNDCAVIKRPNLPVQLWRFVNLGDCNGQYLDDTTDVTRTLHFGTPTDQQRCAFPACSRGIVQSTLPRSLTGPPVHRVSPAFHSLQATCSDDVVTRGPGAEIRRPCLGLRGIGTRVEEQIIWGTSYSYVDYSIRCAAYNSTPLRPSMTVPNEPGYYADGEYNTRIENVAVVRKTDAEQL